MDVGLELRQARERRGISLQQLSHATKISPRVLQAIDAGDEDRLPAPVFTRAFVKTYAVEVGLDPNETLQRYLEQFVKPLSSDAAGEAQREPESSPAALAAIPWRSAGHVLQGRFGTTAVLVLVAVTILALVARRHPGPPSDVADVRPPAVAPTGIVPSNTSQATVGTSGTAPADAGVLHLAIAPTGLCWVQATVGDDQVFGKLLNAGDRRAIDASSDVTLRVGDPATFAFTINGEPARVPGAPGQAVTVHITGNNYTQFLQR
jgi:cytoskeleton protein RodZ